MPAFVNGCSETFRDVAPRIFTREEILLIEREAMVLELDCERDEDYKKQVFFNRGVMSFVNRMLERFESADVGQV